jgi:uncharacterized membrane protein
MKAYSQLRSSMLLKYKYELILLSAIVIYIVYWSDLSVYRIVTFQAAIFDLGSIAQEWYLVLHSTPYSIFLWFINRSPSVIFSPVVLLYSLPAIVVLQTVFLGVPALFIFMISNKVIKNKLSSLIFSIVYLLYPLLYGIQWFDAHNQAFFVFFFLFAFFLYLRKYYISSMVFFLIAGMTHYLLLVFPLLLSFSVFLYSIKEKDMRNFKNKEMLWSIALLISSFFFLALSYYLNKGSVSYTLVIAHSQGFSVSYPNYRLITLLIAIGPVGFLPLIPNRFSILMVPFVLLTFISTAYIYPNILKDQYASMVIPGIFISSIYSFSLLKSKLLAPGAPERSKTKFRKNRYYSLPLLKTRLIIQMVFKRPKFMLSRDRYVTYRRISRIIYGIMFVYVLFLMLSFAPYGYNNNHTEFYNTTLSEQEYSHLYAEFETVASYIPKNDPYVVVGNGEPELMPRPQIPNAPILELPYGLTYNLTYKDLNDGNYSTPMIQYVIGNPYGNQFTGTENPPYNLSMFDLLNRLYDSGQYGIVAEASGIVLLEKNYSGPMKFYVPFSINLSPSYLNAPYILGYVPYYGGNNVYKINSPLTVKESTAFNGPMFLPPGYYRVGLNLSSIVARGIGPSVSFQLTDINGNVLNQSSSTDGNSSQTTLSLSFYINSMEEYTKVHLYVNNATVVVDNLSVQQQQIQYNNLIAESVRVAANLQSVPANTLLLMNLNISQFYSKMNGDFSNILFSLPNDKLVNAFVTGYNSSSSILNVFIDHSFGSQSLKMLIMDKDFDSYHYGMPMGVAPWVHYRKGVPYVINSLFANYSSFINTSLGSEYVISTPQSTSGNYTIGDGLLEETGSGHFMDITHWRGFRPPYELTYVINMSYGNDVPPVQDAIWVSADSPEPIQLWLGNLSYIYLVYSLNGSQFYERFDRPEGINSFSFLLQNTSFSFAINYETVATVYTGNVYKNVSGWYPFTLFDIYQNVVSPRLLGLFLSQPEMISAVNASLYEV